MKKISLIFLAAIVLGVLAWFIPWAYNFFATSRDRAPFTLYSSVIGDFVTIEVNDKKEIYGTDTAGRMYSEEQVDSILPFFYTRQLVSDGRMPDTVAGVAVTPHEIQMTNITYRLTPRDVNRVEVKLYPVLESLSKRVDMLMPEDMMRITDNGVEFIDEESNTVDRAKSDMFTKAMTDKGFTFPAKTLGGNPTTRKEYDEGWLIVDNAGKLFHLKMMVGRPYVRAIDMPEGVVPSLVNVTEFRSRRTLGFLYGNDNRFYVLMSDYTVMPTGVTNFDPSQSSITIMGNMLDWTVRIDNDKQTDIYALDANDFSVLKHISSPVSSSQIAGLTFTSSSDRYVKPRFE